MKKLLCPSMMCADFDSLGAEVEKLTASGADSFHVDIMDGRFVPNFGMGIQDLQTIRAHTDKLIDVHLMIENPSAYVELFANCGADIIYIHSEAETNPLRTLEKISHLGKKAGLAVNPDTSYESVKELLPMVDYVLIMTVNPGFAGQKYVEHVDKKIVTFIQNAEENQYQVMVDGAISTERIARLFKLGVVGFILGTSALFKQETEYQAIIEQIREL